MSHHTDSAATTVHDAGMAWTAALHVYALRCDGCGVIECAGPRDSAERAEIITRNRARAMGWSLAQTTEPDQCAACATEEVSR